MQTAGLLVGELTAKDAGLWTPPSWHDLRKTDPLARKQHQHAQKSVEQMDGAVQVSHCYCGTITCEMCMYEHPMTCCKCQQ